MLFIPFSITWVEKFYQVDQIMMAAAEVFCRDQNPTRHHNLLSTRNFHRFHVSFWNAWKLIPTKSWPKHIWSIVTYVPPWYHMDELIIFWFPDGDWTRNPQISNFRASQLSKLHPLIRKVHKWTTIAISRWKHAHHFKYFNRTQFSQILSYHYCAHLGLTTLRVT